MMENGKSEGKEGYVEDSTENQQSVNIGV